MAIKLDFDCWVVSIGLVESFNTAVDASSLSVQEAARLTITNARAMVAFQDKTLSVQSSNCL